MMSFGSPSNGFSFFGFFGLVVIIVYFIFIVYRIKKRKRNLVFLGIILLLYIILVVWLSLLFNTNITSANGKWPQPVLVCTLIDGIIYLIRCNKK